ERRLTSRQCDQGSCCHLLPRPRVPIHVKLKMKIQPRIIKLFVAVVAACVLFATNSFADPAPPPNITILGNMPVTPEVTRLANAMALVGTPGCENCVSNSIMMDKWFAGDFTARALPDAAVLNKSFGAEMSRYGIQAYGVKVFDPLQVGPTAEALDGYA